MHTKERTFQLFGCALCSIKANTNVKGNLQVLSISFAWQVQCFNHTEGYEMQITKIQCSKPYCMGYSVVHCTNFKVYAH